GAAGRVHLAHLPARRRRRHRHRHPGRRGPRPRPEALHRRRRRREGRDRRPGTHRQQDGVRVMTSFHDLSIGERLNLTRRGTAHYSGQLALVDNAEFGRDTLLPDWTVAHLAAHVAYNANALCNLMHWAETGEETPMYSSPQARGEEIARGATLIPDPI